MITGPRSMLASTERLNGFHGAMAAAGVLPDPSIVLESTFDIEGGAKAAARLLDSAEPPTAIFAFNDNTAIGALRVARERGIRVPEDLSIVGFDDSEHSAIVTPDAHDGAPAARRDGPDGRQPARAHPRRPAPRGAPHRAQDAPDRAQFDRAGARGLSASARGEAWRHQGV